MPRSFELKDFQWASVKAVCEGLERRPVYALADEVGLGKTLVCAEVVNQILANQSTKATHLIYYVAPSIELLHQNLRSIGRYLEDRCGNQFHVLTRISRLSQVPRDIAEHRHRVSSGRLRKGVIHVIGLSPGTSFNLRGAGQFAERMYLAALFGFRRAQERKLDVARFFWCLRRDLDLRSDQKYLHSIESYASEEYLGQLSRFRDTVPFRRLLAEMAQVGSMSESAIRMKVAEVRRHVVDFLITSVSPMLVILDEWHKYKHTCFTNKLLGRFLAQSRASSKTKVLLVSATPFSVEFKEGHQGDAQFEEAGDLEGMLEMVWGKEQYLPHYQQLHDERMAYVEALAAYLKDPAGGDEMLHARRDTYERHLRNYCTRTERPRAQIEATQTTEQSREGDWSRTVGSNSLAGFLRRFSASEHPRTPIVPMWLDGHGFPSYGYPGLERQSNRDIPGLHWKVERLIERLRLDFSFEDRVHSLRCPPLWLRPEDTLRNRKHLIFAEYLFVPEEVCRQLDASPARFGTVAKKKWNGSVLGYFPLQRRRGTGTEQSAADAIHFVLFYPFLVFELEEGDRRRLIAAKRKKAEDIIATETYALITIRRLEELFCAHEGDRKRLEYRWAALDEAEPIPASKRFKDYARFLLFSSKGEWSLSSILARTIGELWREALHAAESDQSQAPSKGFEQATMRLSAAVLRLFASPEAQTLKRRARVRLPRRISRRWNSHVRFAIWYSKTFDLEGTLRGLTKLLLQAGTHSDAVVDEITAAIALRKGAVGNRFVRSFHDRKINDAEYTDAEEVVSLKSLRAAFNSPFPPYVLASTSVGQEGLDFHRYCASVIHWSPPSSPSVLRQREGRVDRFQALQIRRAWQKSGGTHEMTHQGMSPDFVMMKGDQRMNQVDRQVWYLPFTAQEAAWKACLQRMYYSDLLIGSPDPLSDERLLLAAVGMTDFDVRLARFQALQKYSISLRPRALRPTEIEKMRSHGGKERGRMKRGLK
jgi:hypothetical protein